MSVFVSSLLSTSAIVCPPQTEVVFLKYLLDAHTNGMRNKRSALGLTVHAACVRLAPSSIALLLLLEDELRRALQHLRHRRALLLRAHLRQHAAPLVGVPAQQRALQRLLARAAARAGRRRSARVVFGGPRPAPTATREEPPRPAPLCCYPTSGAVRMRAGAAYTSATRTACSCGSFLSNSW